MQRPAFSSVFRAVQGEPDSGPAAGASSVLVAHPSPDLYGSDRVLIESVRGLVTGGMSVTVTLPAQGPLTAEIEEAGATVVICPTPVIRKSILTPRGFASFSLQLARGIIAGSRLMRTASPDVIYVNTLTIPLWSVLARAFGKPVLTHVHEAERSAPRIFRFLLSAPLLLSRSVIANSDFSAAVVADSVRGLAARTVVVYNGVAGPPDPEAARPDLAPSVRLLYVGRLSSRKGVDVAVSALGNIVQRGVSASLDVVGAVFPGYEWYELELRDMVDNLGLSEHVTFHGFTPDVWPHLARTDIVLVPSRLDEPFGNTAVEALLAGRPVIVSDTSGLREAAGNYRSAQLVSPGDAGALAEAIERVVDNWPAYRDHAQTDAAAALARHSPQGYGARISAELKAVLT